MQLEMNVVDAFTDTVFKGNSAAVIITDSWLTDDLMQLIAFENNLSETALLFLKMTAFIISAGFLPLLRLHFAVMQPWRQPLCYLTKILM